jgi:hypothetical protein
MAGYSETPLVKKLGIKEASRFAILNAPDGFERELSPLPATAIPLHRITKNLDLILLFCKKESVLKNEFVRLAKSIKPSGMIWIAWPKKSSKVDTDLAFDNVQRIGLATGLVDVKICAINDVWSGLKFVVRLKNRPSRK